jgi:hypothetical protein
MQTLRRYSTRRQTGIWERPGTRFRRRRRRLHRSEPPTKGPSCPSHSLQGPEQHAASEGPKEPVSSQEASDTSSSSCHPSLRRPACVWSAPQHPGGRQSLTTITRMDKCPRSWWLCSTSADEGPEMVLKARILHTSANPTPG